MKIEIEVNDLKTLIDGLNNSIISYNDNVRSPFILGAEAVNMDPKWNVLTLDEYTKFLSKFDIFDFR